LPPESGEPPLADAPQILYVDETGRPIAPPKNLQGPLTPTPPSLVPQTVSRPTGPTPTAPAVVTAPELPTVRKEPLPDVSEPTFRSVNKARKTEPTLPAPAPDGPKILEPALPRLSSPPGILSGPSLDLPPLPSLTPAPAALPTTPPASAAPTERAPAPLTPLPTPAAGPAPF
jgi:hypothetical protein